MKRASVLIISICFLATLAFPYQKNKLKKEEFPWPEKTLAAMTVDEKIGQLIIPAIVGMFLSQDSTEFQQIRRDITEFHVGGYHMLGEVNILH